MKGKNGGTARDKKSVYLKGKKSTNKDTVKSDFEKSLKAQHFVSKIKREGSTAIKVHINEFKDREPLVDVRVFYQKKGEKKMLPSGKGISVTADEIPELMKALKKAKTALAEIENEGEEEE